MEAARNASSSLIADVLLSRLTDPRGPATILVVGRRGCGKSTACRNALARSPTDVITWASGDEMRCRGSIEGYLTGRQSTAFVDDADVLVREARGSSVGMVRTIEEANATRSVRILLTALGTSGRVWRGVANAVEEIISFPAQPPARKGVPSGARGGGCGRSWKRVLEFASHRVVARSMLAWCVRRDEQAEVDQEGTSAGKGTATTEECEGEGEGEDQNSGLDDGDGACLVRRIASILTR